MNEISPLHPRAESLKIRKKIADGWRNGLVVPEGLVAHGRGEAFDYLLGELTTDEAKHAIDVAAAALVLAKNPVISVNGNAAALVPSDLVKLTRETNASLEVNLFHASATRELKIAKYLKDHGASEVLGVDPEFSTKIPEIHSNRRKVDQRGIAAADAVMVPLEDGDRIEALRKLGKCVISIDLNPRSRSAQAATVTVVDNIVRALPLLIKAVKKLKNEPENKLKKLVENFDNSSNLKLTLAHIVKKAVT
jgi:4-phosphopantoate--beta-alanine ligase